VTIVALGGLLALTLWYTWVRLQVLRRRVTKESDEVATALHVQISNVRSVLAAKKEALIASRKTQKLTKAEEELISAMEAVITSAERGVEKEVTDVQKLVKKK
jgi:hypothetical protein